MLTRFLKKHGWRYIPGFLFLLVSSYITTLAPIALGHAIDYMDMDVALIDQSKVYRQAFYIILILLYIKFIYHDSNYDSLIMYFITLAVGRFLYFDSTLEDIKETLQGVARNLPLLVLMGSYSAIVCWYGFHCGFLLTSNGVILSTLLAHLFMDVSIFVLDKTQLVKLFI